MKTLNIPIIASISLLICGCVTGPTPAEIRAKQKHNEELHAIKLAKEAQRQTEILQNQSQLSLTDQQSAAISTIIEKIQAIVKTVPKCDFAFNKQTGIFTYTSGKNTQMMSVMDIRHVEIVNEGPTSSYSMTQSGGVTVTSFKTSNRDPDGLYIMTGDYAKLVRKVRDGTDSWLPYVYINEFPHGELEQLRQLFGEAMTLLSPQQKNLK